MLIVIHVLNDFTVISLFLTFGATHDLGSIDFSLLL